MKFLALAFGAIAVLLGGLWMLQGLGLVHIQPIACVADCRPIENGSALWASIGFAVAAAGALTLWFAIRGASWRR